MLPTRHFAISAAAGGVVWASTGEPLALPVTTAVGTLLDGDHIPDMWWNFVLRRTPVFTVLAHGWEWIGVLLALGVWVHFPWWLIAIIAGHGLHVISDHVFNARGSTWAYSVLYRARHRFRAIRLIDDWDFGFDTAYEHLRQETYMIWRLVDWAVRRQANRHEQSG